MMVMLNIISLLCLLAICFQDFRERKLYAWLIIITAILLSFTYFLKTSTTQYMVNIGLNVGIVILIIGILFLYAKLKLKTALSNVLGLGDILFFIVIAISFPISTFVVLFSFSLLFSLVLYLVAKPSLKDENVPLAGLQALFL